MPGRLGLRFAIEALFLIALAVGAGLADLAARWIVLIMAGGWLIVALLELTAERLWATVPAWRRPYYPAAVGPPPAPPPPEVEPEPVAEVREPPRLEPLHPRRRRRWFGRREEPPEEPELPPPPKHVRLLPTTPREDRITDEVAEVFD